MKLANFGRIAGALALSIGLSGCFDMTTDVWITSETEGKATVTQVMGAEIYGMVKSAGDGATSEPFCKEAGQTLTENADGSGTCVIISEGAFDTLKFDDGGSKPVFTVVSPGVVRAAVATKDMVGELGKGDEETQAMMKQMFEGRNLTIRFGGKAVTDTNMTLNADGTYAEIVIPFLDLINGTAVLPDELYAVIDTN
ncbi:MAG: hypothetical protein ABIO40_03920 [Devosia sp.]